MVEKLIQLKLPANYIAKIINYNLAPRFVEFCLLNNIVDIDEMSNLYDKYLNGEDMASVLKRKK